MNLARRGALIFIVLNCVIWWLAAPAWAFEPSQHGIRLDGVAWLTLSADGGGISGGFEYDGLTLRVACDVPINHGLSAFAGLGTGAWGPGRTGGLILGGGVLPTPAIGYSIKADKSEYVRFACLLGLEGGRRLLGHRLEYRPFDRLTLGISETAATSGDMSALMYWPFPGLPLYALQRAAYQADRGQDSLINVNFGADFAFKLGKEGSSFAPAEFYGELLIDDAQSLFGSSRAKVPDMVGILVGAEFPDLSLDGKPGKLGVGVEYVAIANFVYSHRNPDNTYVLHGVPIGHWLGPDGDLLQISAEYRASDVLSLLARVAVERHGEGRLGKSWFKYRPAPTQFPSGIVEREVRVSAGAEFTTGPAVIGAELGLKAASNAGNVEGVDSRGGWIGLELGIRL